MSTSAFSYELRQKGYRLHSQGKFEAAIACFDEYLKSYGEDTYVLSLKASSANSALLYQKALDCYNRIIQLKRNDEFAWNYKVMLLEKMERSKEAQEAIEEAIQTCENPAFAWKLKADRLRASGKLEEAIECYHNSMQNGKNPFSWYYISTIYAQMKKVDESIHSLKEFIQCDPENTFPLTELAKKLMTQGLFEEALELLEKATLIDDTCFDAWDLKRKIYKKLKKVHLNLQCLKKLLLLEPEDEVMWFKCAKTLLSIGQKEIALEFLDRVISIKKYYQAYRMKGEILKELEKFPEALYCFDEALSMRSYSYDLESEKAVILCYLGRINEGVTIANSFLMDDSEQNMINIGLVFLWNGEKKKAMEQFEGVLQKSLDNQWAKLGKAFLLDIKGDQYNTSLLVGECSKENFDWFKRRLAKSYLLKNKMGPFFRRELGCPQGCFPFQSAPSLINFSRHLCDQKG